MGCGWGGGGGSSHRPATRIFVHIGPHGTLTQDKIKELKEEIKSSTPPDIIATTELNPKNRELTENEYKLDGYRFEKSNLRDKGSTRGIEIYIRNSLNCSKIAFQNIASGN